MVLVTTPDYDIIRGYLRAGVADLPDANLVGPGILAEKRIRLLLGDVAVDTATGFRLAEIEQAANYLTASIVAPTMKGSSVDVTNIRVGDSSMTRATSNWMDVQYQFDLLANELLNGPAPIEIDEGYAYFSVVKDRGGRRRVEGTSW